MSELTQGGRSCSDATRTARQAVISSERRRGYARGLASVL